MPLLSLVYLLTGDFFPSRPMAHFDSRSPWKLTKSDTISAYFTDRIFPPIYFHEHDFQHVDGRKKNKSKFIIEIVFFERDTNRILRFDHPISPWFVIIIFMIFKNKVWLMKTRFTLAIWFGYKFVFLNLNAAIFLLCIFVVLTKTI